MKFVAIDDQGNQIPLPEVSEIPAWLAKHREERGLSLQAVADYVGVAKQAVWTWEKGKIVPMIEHLARMMELFSTKKLVEATAPYELKNSKKSQTTLEEVEDILGV